MDYESLPKSELIRMLQDLDRERAQSGKDGITLTYTGRAAPWQIIRQVKPKLTTIKKSLSAGPEAIQAQNLIVSGENLSSMVTLYKYRGQVDLILTDPPYNTGNDFRYNDKWDTDPNDPDLGPLVPEDDGSRHSKWLRFMTPRLWMMREMLKPGGVIAICIDHRELYRLGVLMDEIFPDNRLGIINWQKTYSPKNNVGERTHVSTSTEYVLVYAKSIDRAKTNLLPRSEEMNARYNDPPDGDPEPWTPGDLSGPGAESHAGQVYGVQNPFTGELCYPAEGRCWAAERARMKAMLEAWGCKYEDRDVKDGKKPALVVKGSLAAAKKAAEAILKKGCWPIGYWRDNGLGAFRFKKYLKDVKRGVVPMTYWADEDYESPEILGSVSWDHEQSGHSQAGLNELNAIVGRNHRFDTVKPLKLFKKLIQIWCPPQGIVVDPFAGSGTAAHAVIELNHEQEANRKFVLVEQGNDEKGDYYAKTLTADRIRRVLSGEWASGKRQGLPGGFRFVELKREKIDADAVNALAREEMIDLLLTSYWDKSEKAKSYLERRPAGAHKFLFGVNPKNEGFYLVWEAGGKPSVLNRETLLSIMDEGKAHNLAPRYHIYASSAPYTGRSVEFYKIPDKVLEHIGFNVRADAYNAEKQPEATHV